MNIYVLLGVMWAVWFAVSMLIGWVFYRKARKEGLELDLQIKTTHWLAVITNVILWFGAICATYFRNVPGFAAVIIISLVWIVIYDRKALSQCRKEQAQRGFIFRGIQG